MRMLALRLRLGEIAKVVRFHQGQWGHHNEGDETHRDPPWEKAGHTDDGRPVTERGAPRAPWNLT